MLKFIGIGSCFNTQLGNTSAYYKENKSLLIIDCGESIFSKILEQNLLKDVKNVYIAITHTHSDHVGSLGSFVFYLNYIKGIIPKIITTIQQKKTINEYLALSGVAQTEYDLIKGNELGCFSKLEKIVMNRANHTDRLTSYAIELYFKDNTIYYVGDNNDSNYIKSIVEKLKENDIIYTDATIQDYPNSVHITLATLSEIIPLNRRKQVKCMHFDGEDTIEKAKSLGFGVASCE